MRHLFAGIYLQRAATLRVHPVGPVDGSTTFEPSPRQELMERLGACALAFFGSGWGPGSPGLQSEEGGRR